MASTGRTGGAIWTSSWLLQHAQPAHRAGVESSHERDEVRQSNSGPAAAAAAVTATVLAMKTRYPITISNMAMSKDNRATNQKGPRFVVPLLLFLPHSHEHCQILIPRPLRLHELKRLAQELLHIHVPPLSEEILHRRRKLSIQIARKCMARIIDENPNQHDGIVLHVPRGLGRVGEGLANVMGGLFGGIGA